MPSSQHWLVRAAQSAHPDTVIPAAMEIAPTLRDAWAQVCALFQITSVQLTGLVAQAFGVPAGTLHDFQPAQGSCLPQRLCLELQLVPLWHKPDVACIAVSDPRLTLEQRKQLGFAAKRPIELVVLAPDDIDTCLTRLFAGAPRSGALKTAVIDLLRETVDSADNTTVKLVSAVLRSAIDRNASDVHIHPFVGGGAIRFRVDGVLQRIATLPIETLQSISRYLKTHAGLDPNPLKPQDGRLRLKYALREIDVRLSILPAYDGDRIVCRLLDQSRNFSLQHSRFSIADQQALRKLVGEAAGMVLLTGPTGSGKTSTLYALLSELNNVDVNVMTIEDPVEYVLPGISQVQVHEKQGLSFADTLRSILRQDPDVVLVGEIRDEETARIALQASLTGHLVLSTLHTNDALGAIPRLLDLHLDPSVLADALLGVVSQRLVRCLCEACRVPRPERLLAAEEEFGRITGELPAYRAVGCEHCGYTGYRGRLPVIEYLAMTAGMRQALLTGERSLVALKEAAQGHRRSMAMSAKDWIVSGMTTVQEVHKVLGAKFWSELAQEHGSTCGTEPSEWPSDIAAPAQRHLAVLLVSKDEGLAQQWRALQPYRVECVADPAAATRYLAQQQNVIALAFDAALCAADPAQWLVDLRTQFTSTGLPALFVLRDNPAGLAPLLDRYGAVHLSHAQACTPDLAAALNRLLQGVH